MASRKQTGLQLRTHRTNAGMTPESLGHKVGLSGMTIRRLENGVGCPTVRTRFLIARELGLEVTDIWPLETRRVAA